MSQKDPTGLNYIIDQNNEREGLVQVYEVFLKTKNLKKFIN